MNGIKIEYISLLRIIIFFKLIHYNNMLECNDITYPFEKIGHNSCADSCSKSEINIGTCIIRNEIIKVQWLNNIIYFAPGGYGYINIAVTESDNLYVITSCYPNNNQRYIYLLNREGIGWFEGSPFTISYVEDSENKGRYESSAFTIKSYSNQEKSYQDYLISISKADQNVEILDFYAGRIYVKQVISAFGSLNNVFSFVVAHVKLSNSNNLNIYLIGLLATEYQDSQNHIDYFYLKKTKFSDSLEPEVIKETKVKTLEGSYMVSCYEITTPVIVCFYRNENKKYTMIVFNQDLEEKDKLSFEDGNSKDEIFLKCVHFWDKTGAFAYFTDDTQPLLIIRFKKFDNGQIIDYSQSVPYLILNNYNLNIFMTLNDIAKVNDKKLYYVGTSSNNRILYIISIINYIGEKFMTRIYSVNMYNFHNNYNFNRKIGIVIYKNMLAMASSFLYGSDQASYSSIIIFGYPNTTDVIFEISDYLFKNNDIKINNLLVGINGNFIMENNIFGYIYSGIKFIDTNCVDLNDIYLTKENNENITQFYFLEKNKTIKLVIPKRDNYNTFACTFRYACTVSEPEYSEFNKYPEKTNFTGGTNEEEKYFESQKTNYLGKYSYYSLYLDKKLTEKDCEENCELCLYDKSKCLTCKYSANILEDKKICENESLLISTEVQFETERITELSSEIKTTEVQSAEVQSAEVQSTEIQSTEIQSTEIQSTIIEKSNEIIKSEVITNFKASYEEINEISEGKEDIKSEKIFEKCNIEEIKENKCIWEISNDQVDEIYSYIKENLIKKNESIVIKTGNTIFEISTTNEQKMIKNENISNIDLGQCEVELKNKNNISESQSLIIFKIDIKSIDKKTTYVKYEVYHPTTYEKLNMSVCKDLTIDIYTPVSLNQIDSLLFHSLSESGYNLYNKSDPFYNEICTPYTTINGTDILLLDRKVDIYSKIGNEALCQIGCELLFYDENSKKAKCKCNVIENEECPDLKDGFKFDKKEIADSFFDTLSNSNFLVLKCYKLALDLKKLFENKGRIMMTVFFILFMILLIFYCFRGNKELNFYLEQILKEKLMNENHKRKLSKQPTRIIIKQKRELKRAKSMMNIKKKKKSKLNLKKKSKSNKRIGFLNDINENKKHKNKNNERNKNKKEGHNNKNSFDNKESKKNIKSKEVKKDKLFPPKKKVSISRNVKFKNSFDHSEKTGTSQNIIFSVNNYYYGEQMNKKSSRNSKLINNNTNCILKNSSDSLMIHKEKEKNIKQAKQNFCNSSPVVKKKKPLTEFEINSLNYELALIIDKRTYFQYYWSLLKQKHLILFTFLPANDFNLPSLKISLFILSFSLYFAINGFFFNDSSMHKIYKDNGAFNILFQIPQILYSTLVSSVINILLKNLSLSQKDILRIKKEKNNKIAMKKSREIKHCIQIKFIIFFILSFLLILFFWYFISCFCAVYKNTQKILIKDTLLSFVLSMLYPIGLNLLPGILRIPSLKAKNKKCMYEASKIIALI